MEDVFLELGGFLFEGLLEHACFPLWHYSDREQMKRRRLDQIRRIRTARLATETQSWA